MRDLSLHLLDLAQNSISAEAKNISIKLSLNEKEELHFFIQDDGRGMDSALVQSVLSPFTTSRTSRKVGMGIPLMKESAESTGGSFKLNSVPDKGTELLAVLNTRHIDCIPLGDVAESFVSLVCANPRTPEFNLSLESPTGSETYQTRELKQMLDGVELTEPEVIEWLRRTIDDTMKTLFGGKI